MSAVNLLVIGKGFCFLVFGLFLSFTVSIV
nr:MAG TPA: hypothetical protein [Caudoviricetes sp.]